MTGPIDAILDLRGKSDVLKLADPFRLTVSVDQSLIDRGQYGNVGEATVTIESTSLDPYMFFDPSADLPVIRLNKDNQRILTRYAPAARATSLDVRAVDRSAHLTFLAVVAACTSTTPVSTNSVDKQPQPASPTQAPGATAEPPTPTPPGGSFSPQPIPTPPHNCRCPGSLPMNR